MRGGMSRTASGRAARSGGGKGLKGQPGCQYPGVLPAGSGKGDGRKTGGQRLDSSYEPQNGEIYACVNVPEFDLNDPFTLQQDTTGLRKRNSGSAEPDVAECLLKITYEPGDLPLRSSRCRRDFSEGVVSPNDSFFCPGYKNRGGPPDHCHKRTGHGAENFVQGAQNSCNPVFIEVGLRLGVEKFCDYLPEFGLMEKTGIDLPGEASTIMHKEENIGEVELATMAFGQSFQITPIRLAATVSALVNGGKMVTPHVATDVLDEEGNVVKHLNFPEKKGFFRKKLPGRCAKFWKASFQKGLERMRTSRDIPSAERRQLRRHFRGAPTAIFPHSSASPRRSIRRLLGLCIIRNPQGVYYGGTICAPVIRDIFSNVLPYLGIGHNSQEPENCVLRSPHLKFYFAKGGLLTPESLSYAAKQQVFHC